MNPTWQIEVTDKIREHKDPERPVEEEIALLVRWGQLRGLNMVETAESHYWDGEGNLVIRDTTEEMSHDLGHWLVSSDEQRACPEFGLGYYNPPAKFRRDLYSLQESVKAEDRANIASYFIRMYLGIFDLERVARPRYAEHFRSFYGHLTWLRNRNIITRDGILVP